MMLSRLHRSMLPLLAVALAAPGAARAQLDVRKAARDIDRLVESGLERAGERPRAIVDDATFVRRAYLSLVGRIPTVAETEAFLQSGKRDKRARLVDALIDSPGYGSHQFNYWADVLRVKTRLNNVTSGEPYIHWLKQSIADNKPYDRFVTELLTAEGAAHARGNGATGYYLRDRGMLEDNMSNTVRVFLGTRLECAQCHNHPFDKWKQTEFFEMAAFTGGLQYRQDMRGSPHGQRLQKLTNEVRREHGRDGQRVMGRILRNFVSGIAGSGTGVTRLPKEYKYDDAKPRQIVHADTMFGADVEIDLRPPRRAPQQRGNRRRPGRRAMPTGYAPADSRAAYAAWMTSPDNPRFTKVIANRMWKRLLGRGLIEPVDDMKEDSKADNPALMRYLEQLMVDVGYDLREFQRVVARTEVFQRAASRCDLDPDKPYLFAGPVLRRMSAEQIWDSVMAMVVPDLDAKLVGPAARAEPVYKQYEAFLDISREDLMARVELEMMRYKDPEKYREMRRKQAGAMSSMRDAARDAMRAAQRKIVEERNRELKRLRDRIAKATRAKADKAEIARLRKQVRAVYEKAKKRQAAQARSYRRRGGRGAQLARASDLPSPAPASHFLRQFGQSDREQIEAAHSDASVPQVLTLLNGVIENRLAKNPGAALTRSLAAASGREGKIRAAFLGILNREPRSNELATWMGDVSQFGDQAYQDLVWTLINCHEFRFIQ